MQLHDSFLNFYWPVFQDKSHFDCPVFSESHYSFVVYAISVDSLLLKVKKKARNTSVHASKIVNNKTIFLLPHKIYINFAKSARVKIHFASRFV